MSPHKAHPFRRQVNKTDELELVPSTNQACEPKGMNSAVRPPPCFSMFLPFSSALYLDSLRAPENGSWAVILTCRYS